MAKTVLVTGATSGFGKAIAIVFAKNGYNVCITGRREERLRELKQELEGNYKVSITTLCFDIRSRAEVTKAVEELKTQHSTIDILVNNALLSICIATVF